MMTERKSDMDMQRLEVLLDAYGADPARWPAAERAAALALLAADPAARAGLEQARQLDRALDALPPAPAPAGDLAARIRVAAQQRDATLQRDSGPAAPQPIPVAGPVADPVPANSNRPAWRFPAALTASALLGLWLGFATGPFPIDSGGTTDLAALDQQDVAVLAFGPFADTQNGNGGIFHE